MDLAPVENIKCPEVSFEFLKDSLSLEMEQLKCLSLSKNQSLPEEWLMELIQIIEQASYFSQLKELSLPLHDEATDDLVQFILDFFTNQAGHLERCGLACEGLMIDSRHLEVHEFTDKISMIIEAIYMQRQEKGTTNFIYRAPIANDSQF